MGLAAAVVIADQLVKGWVLANLRVEDPVTVAGDYLRLTLIHNSGGLFGLFQNQAIVFAIVSLAVMGLMIWYHARAAAGNLLLTVTIGLLLGGAIGNFIDRVRLGYVLDFVDAGLGTWRWYTFNVADSAISLSILLLLVLAFRPGSSQAIGGPPPRPATDEQAGGGQTADGPTPEEAATDAPVTDGRAEGRPSPDGHGGA